MASSLTMSSVNQEIKVFPEETHVGVLMELPRTCSIAIENARKFGYDVSVRRTTARPPTQTGKEGLSTVDSPRKGRGIRETLASSPRGSQCSFFSKDENFVCLTYGKKPLKKKVLRMCFKLGHAFSKNYTKLFFRSWPDREKA